MGLDAKVEAWRRAHPLPATMGTKPGECPVCTGQKRFGRHPKNPERWFCFGESPHSVGRAALGAKGGWWGDALDLEAAARGYSGADGRLRVLRDDGYLDGKPLRSIGRRPPNLKPSPPPKREPTAAEHAARLAERWSAADGPTAVQLPGSDGWREVACEEGLDAARLVDGRPVARGYRRAHGREGPPLMLAELVPLAPLRMPPGLVLAAEPGEELLEGHAGDLLLVEPARWLEYAYRTWAAGRWLGVLGLTDARPLAGALPWRGAVYVGPGLDAVEVAAVLRPDPDFNSVLRRREP